MIDRDVRVSPSKAAVKRGDRGMRGEGAREPTYEGGDGLIAWMLNGPQARCGVPHRAPGEAKRTVPDSHTRERSGEYRSPALIDLAFRMREQIADFDDVDKIDGANDPWKLDPKSSRETPDHSIMSVFAVAPQDGNWHHLDSYAPKRASRPSTVALWRKIETTATPDWPRCYRAADRHELSSGGRVEIFLRNGNRLEDEKAVANAHLPGARPFGRDATMHKFRTMTAGIITTRKSNRILEAAQDLPRQPAGELHRLNIACPPARSQSANPAFFKTGGVYYE